MTSGSHLLARVAEYARRRPSAVAVRELRSGAAIPTLTYAALDACLNAFAQRLRAHVHPGCVVLLCSPNRTEVLPAFLAVLAAGAVVMPIHPALTTMEVLEVVRRTRAVATVCSAERKDEFARLGLPCFEIDQVLNGIVAPSPHPPVDPALASRHSGLMLQTSGTTGEPNIACRSARSLDAVARNVAESVGLREDDRVLAAIPLCHSYGVENGLLGPLWAGSAVHVTDGLHLPIVFEQLMGGATVFPGVPFMFEVLADAVPLRAGDSAVVSSLRTVYSAGSALPTRVEQAFAARFGLRVGQLYGSTEVGSVTFSDPNSTSFDPSSVGRPMPGVDIRIVAAECPQPSRPLAVTQEGLVAVSAPSMLDRYLDAQAPIFEGYFLTGDLGRLDSEGRLTITGRLKLLIDVGGFKVNPTEVELVIKEHPSVGECIVVPMPLTQTVSRLKAIVTGRGDAPISTDDLRQFARARLAAYKVPRMFEVRKDLPRSPTGKVLLRQLETVE